MWLAIFTCQNQSQSRLPILIRYVWLFYFNKKLGKRSRENNAGKFLGLILSSFAHSSQAMQHPFVQIHFLGDCKSLIFEDNFAITQCN